MSKKRKRPNGKRHRAQQRLERLLEDLEVVENPVARVERWQELAALIKTQCFTVCPDLVLRLLNLQAAERVDAVWRAAANTISVAELAMEVQRRRRERQGRGPAGVGDWYWEALRKFQKQSWVLRVADPKRLRRDEDAVIEIARSLFFVDYPLARFLCVDPGHFAPGVRELDEVVALCLMGRLSLYGDEVARRWGMPEEHRRYYFPMKRRPANLPPGKLHRRYHAIVEKSSNGSGSETWHRASQNKHCRTDYGLVQRYVIRTDDHDHVVLAIAGTSSLGTLGAAHFAAHRLLLDGVGKKMFPLPQRYRDDSRLEALVEVTAPLQGSNLGWELKGLKLVNMHFDDYIWSESQRDWQLPTLRDITVEFPSEYARRNFRDAEDAMGTTVYFEDRKAKVREKSENRRLITALCLLAEDGGGTVEFAQLGQDTWIWKGRVPKEASHVHTRLTNEAIRKQFGPALVLEQDKCHLSAKVHITIGALRNHCGCEALDNADGRGRE